MFLGIEIGGTKLQLGVGNGDGTELVALHRSQVDPDRGADGILEQIEAAGLDLLRKHPVTGIGIGFGGPVHAGQGRVVTSHQVTGWNNRPLVEWCRTKLGLPAVLANDCDAASLAEARFGAGRGARVVFYVTVGTGIGGGVVIDGCLYESGKVAAAEIGHLRPGFWAETADRTVESISSGHGIEAAVRSRLASDNDAVDLLARCGGYANSLTTRLIAEAAQDGNFLALDVLGKACKALGWAIAQSVTLLAPDVIVIGGGVSLIGEDLFFRPVREEVERYVFPPLRETYRVVPAGLGELVVVHGALAVAASARDTVSNC